MKTCNGGAKVRSGYYWNLRAWEVVTVSGARHGAGFEGAESTLPAARTTASSTSRCPCCSWSRR